MTIDLSKDLTYGFAMAELRTVARVVAALGSNRGVVKLTGMSSMNVSNWKKSGKFPPRFYVAMQAALNQSGFTAPARLWGMERDKRPKADTHAETHHA